MQKMLDNGWLGSKSGQGFYLKKGKEILELNTDTLEYGPRKKLKTASTELSKQEKGLHNKMKALVYADDKAGNFLWNILSPVLLYSGNLLSEIADDIVPIDQAMKWGFGWELGPFETWDSIGLEKSVAKMKEEGKEVPAWISEMLEAGQTSFYKEEDGEKYFYHNGEYEKVERNPKVIDLKAFEKTRKADQEKFRRKLD